LQRSPFDAVVVNVKLDSRTWPRAAGAFYRHLSLKAEHGRIQYTLFVPFLPKRYIVKLTLRYLILT